MKFDGPFAPGARMRGTFTPTMVDAGVAQTQRKYEGTPIEMTVEQMEP